METNNLIDLVKIKADVTLWPKESERDTELSRTAKCGFIQESEAVTAAQSPVVEGQVGWGQGAKLLKSSKGTGLCRRQPGISGSHFWKYQKRRSSW